MTEMPKSDDEPVTYIGKLTPDRWSVVMFVLRRHAMPYEVSAPIIAELQQQLLSQQQARRSTEAVTDILAAEDSKPKETEDG